MKTVDFKTTVMKTVVGLGMLGAALLSETSAGAVPLSTGAPQSLSGTTVAARPELAGTVIEDRVRAFSFTTSAGATIRGTFQDRVVKRTDTGKLEFSFRIKNDSASVGNIVVVNRQNYGAYPTVDVDYRIDGLGTIGAPAAAHGGGTNARIKFDFNSAPIVPGSESRFHFIGTEATGYDESGQVGLQSNNGGYTTFKVFSPKIPIVITVKPPVLALWKKPNLRNYVFLSGSATVRRGEDISARVKVRVTNPGNASAPGTAGTLSPANGFMIDLMLSKDKFSPSAFATYSPKYSDDVLLLGGRISITSDLAAGGSIYYTGGATIPANTPPGNYYLSARVDPAGKVDESNENDNTYFLPIKVVASKAVPID